MMDAEIAREGATRGDSLALHVHKAPSGPDDHGKAGDGKGDDGKAGGAPAGDLAHGADPASQAGRVLDPVISKLAPGADKKETGRKIRHYFFVGLSIGIFILAIYVVARTFSQISFDELRGAVAATSGEQIASAALLTAVSFLALTGYDALALRQLKLRVPYPVTALASFTSYAISFTLGFPLITAGTVRYWIYSSKGLSGGKVASLTVIAGLTFWLGMALLIGIGFAVRANGVSNLDHLDPLANRVIGIAIILGLLGYLVWAAQGHRHATIQGFKLELPGFWLTAGQICLGLIDLCAASGVLFVLLSPPRSIDYLTFVTVYVFGSLLGIVSNAPGGIGVFEATMLKTVPAHSEAALFASLLLFRIIYYIVPFVLALAMLGAHESMKRWASLRAAMTRDDEG